MFSDKNNDGSITAGTEILQENHYYPFGLAQEGSWTVNTSNPNDYLYNGKELDTDFGLNWYHYGARMYDPAIGRFPSIDRFAVKYAHQSPYTYAANSPINFIDVNGDSIWIAHKGNNYLYDGGKLSLNGSEYTGKVKGFLKKTVNALSKISGSSEGAAMLSELRSSTNNFTIKHASSNPKGRQSEFNTTKHNKAYANQLSTDPAAAKTYSALKKAGVDLSGGSGGTIYWDPSGVQLPTTSGAQTAGFSDLAHEMFHGLDANRGLLDDRSHSGVDREEWQAVYRENVMRGQLTMPLRTHYIKSVDPSGKVLGGAGPRMITPANKPILPSWYKR